MTANNLLMISQPRTLRLRVCVCARVDVFVYNRARNSTKLWCFSPVHLRVPACSSSWPEVASAHPAAPPTSAARCSAAPAAGAPPAPLVLVSAGIKDRSKVVLNTGQPQ